MKSFIEFMLEMAGFMAFSLGVGGLIFATAVGVEQIWRWSMTTAARKSSGSRPSSPQSGKESKTGGDHNDIDGGVGGAPVTP